METTKELFERAKKAAGCQSNYQFAKRFGMTQSSASNYANGKTHFDADRSKLIAEIIGVDVGYVLACANAERAKTEAEKISWERIASMVSFATLGPRAAEWRRG